MNDHRLQIYTKTPDQVVDTLRQEMAAMAQEFGEQKFGTGGPAVAWQPQADGPALALAKLFARLVEILANRLNQTPDQHVRAFLNEAELEPLPPLAAETDLTFVPAPDSGVIAVPPRTQAATKPAPGQPEIIFETEQPLNVVPAALAACVALDATHVANRTAQAAGQEPDSFDPFVADEPRTRHFYLGHDTLFTFADDASRSQGALLLDFDLQPPPNPPNAPPGDWPETVPVAWSVYDAATQAWREVAQKPVPAVAAEPDAGAWQLRLDHLPPLPPSEVHGQQSHWLRATLVDAGEAPFFPLLTLRAIRQVVAIDEMRAAPVDAALAGVQGGEVFTPLETASPFAPLGRVPAPLDAFYLRVDEAFSKPDATVQIELDLAGLPVEIDDPSRFQQLRLEWEYFGDKGWLPLGASCCPCPMLVRLKQDADAARNKQDADVPKLPRPQIRTGIFYRYIEFRIPPGFAQPLPPSLQRAHASPDPDGGTRYALSIPERCVPHFEPIWADACTESQLPDDPERAAILDRPDAAALPDQHSFRDTTCALTKSGVVAFKVPGLAKTSVAGQEGYWVRARLIAGGYEEPVRAGPLARWTVGEAGGLPPKLHPPVVTRLEVTYGAFQQQRPPATPALPDAQPGAQPDAQLDAPGAIWAGTHCWSKTDHAYWRDHRPQIQQGSPLAPFAAAAALEQAGNQPALYLAFAPLDPAAGAAFPPDTWVQLHVEALEPDGAPAGAAPHLAAPWRDTLAWDYWTGQQWQPLRVIDGTAGLTQRGYLRLLAPPVAPPPRRPEDPPPPLDASLDFAQSGRPLTWLRVTRHNQADAPGHLRLGALRLNTVPARNAETIRREILGSSNGEPNQQFRLARTPVLSAAADLSVEVRETVQPLSGTPRDGTGADGGGPDGAGPNGAGPDAQGQWIAWTPAESLTLSGPESRVYLLDPVQGVVRFGDGVRGYTPPPGLGNIRITYRVHAGAAGNTAARQITALRNPAGSLSKIRAVTNHSAASGGRAGEALEPFLLRARQLLRHRRRAVTYEDYQWLALEVAGVARAYCLPTTRPDGELEAGHVAMVVVPKPSDARRLPGDPGQRAPRLLPTPALLRRVQAHLAAHAWADLAGGASDRIHVRAPDYLEIWVQAQVTPTDPARAGETRLDVLQALDEFLHPLTGGPQRTGWEAGRDVYLSEVAYEIERLPSVDHVQQLALHTQGIQAQVLELDLRPRAWDLPAGSQVSSFDERVKLLLGETLAAHAPPHPLVAYGFKLGDSVYLIQSGSGARVGAAWNVAALAGATGAAGLAPGLDKPRIVLDKPVGAGQLDQALRAAGDDLALVARDGRICLPVTALRPANAGGLELQVRGLAATDRVSLVHRHQRRRSLHDLTLVASAGASASDRVFVPPDHLVYAGQHAISIVV